MAVTSAATSDAGDDTLVGGRDTLDSPRTEPVGRKAAAEFFTYKLREAKGDRADVNLVLVFLPTLAAIGGVFYLTQNPLYAAAAGVGAAILFYGLLYSIAASRARGREGPRFRNEPELYRLASELRAVQGRDLSVAFDRMIQRLRLEEARLYVLNGPETPVWVDEAPASDEAKSRAERLKPYAARFVSIADPRRGAVRRVNWRGDMVDVYANPLRLQAVFVTMEMAIVAEAEIDSLVGALTEKQWRAPLTALSGVELESARLSVVATDRPPSENDEDADTEATPYDRMHDRPDGAPPPPRIEQSVGMLVIRADGAERRLALEGPSRLGASGPVLLGDAALSPGEIAIDDALAGLDGAFRVASAAARGGSASA